MTSAVLTSVLQSQIKLLEVSLLECPQVEVPMIHWLVGHFYHRAILVRKDTLITGARHLQEHECLSIGDISVSTDVGVKRLQGYHRLWAQAGKKRVGYAHENTIWVTTHWTDQLTLIGKEEELSFPEEHKLLAEARSRRNRGTLLNSNAHGLIPH